MSPELYFSIALVDMCADAGICLAHEKRYNIIASFILSMLWPVTIPTLLILASIFTKDYPSWYAKEQAND